MKRWIFFDLDGTLTDPMIGITSGVKYALSRFGIEVNYLRELIPFIGPPLKESFMKYYGLTAAQATEAIGYYREYYGPKGLYQNEVYPGMKELLVRLEQAGFELAVATSKPTEYSKIILKHFGLLEHFALVMGSEFDGRRVEKAEVIEEVLKQTKARREEVLMVGDRKHDVIGARSCGVDSIGVVYGYGSKDELKKAGATYIADTVEDLEKVIFQILEEEQKPRRAYTSWNRNTGGYGDPVTLDRVLPLGILGQGKETEKFYQANRFNKRLNLVDDFDQTEAVFVCTDFDKRYEDCMAVLDAGRHVLCLPPAADSVDKMKALYDKAQEKDLIFMEAIPAIYAPAFPKMRPYMNSLGKIRHATFMHCHYDMAYEPFKRGMITEDFDPVRTGGALFHMGVYPVACMVQLFGAPKSVKAYGISLANGINASGSILFEYEGMLAEVIYSMLSDSAMPSQIQGEEGSMLIREIDNIKDLRISRRKVDQAIHFEQSDNIYQHVTNAFLDMIKTGLGMEGNRERSLETMEILEEARRQMEKKEER